MSLANTGLKPCVYECIPGTGVLRNGVVIDANTTGPWDIAVPDDACVLDDVDACAGGSAGGSGGNGAGNTSVGGGGGGPAGFSIIRARLPVLPGSTITVTVGLGGAPGALQAVGAAGGLTSIAGLMQGPRGTTWTLYGYDSGGFPGNGVNGAFAYGGTAPEPIFNNAVAGGGTSSAAGAAATQATGVLTSSVLYGKGFARSGGGGGAGNTSGASAGGNGGTAGAIAQQAAYLSTLVSGGTGDTTGSLSRGGGGAGACGPFGLGGAGGAGGAAGSNGAGYGSGGGGGGGNAVGGSGANGYARFVIWSANL